MRVIMPQWVGREFRYLVEGGLVGCKAARQGRRKREREERRREKEKYNWP